MKVFKIISFFMLLSMQVKALKLEPLVQTEEIIWGFTYISDSEIIFTEREGSLFYYNIKSKEKIKIPHPKYAPVGQGGLLDVLSVIHQKNHYIYLTYSEKYKGQYVTTLARGVYKNKTIKSFENLFRTKIKSNTKRHFGSRLVMKDGFLFMTVGDRGERDYSQSLESHQGKILRLTLDGKAAPGNPFIGQAKALDEIWSYGHRNPQGIDINPKDGKLYSCEFGPRGGDELNLIEKSKNYGWPTITYGREYWGPKIGPPTKPGLEQPITYWTPSISPSGMVFYRGEKIKKWKGNLFLANLSSTHLRRLVLKDGKVIEQEELFKDRDERFRQVRNTPDGFLAVSTDGGFIYKVLP
ncbi:MAG: PQQ-dependent sugar dehydrogenase [Bacteriovoracaceae bacterium]